MENNRIYLYGMILLTKSLLLKDQVIRPDEYHEAEKMYLLPGGETGTCGTVLASLGCEVVLDGNYMGKNTYGPICDFYHKRGVDTSLLTYKPDEDGLEDFVIISGKDRTIFGRFQDFYSQTNNRWNVPREQDIIGSAAVGIDPFFGEECQVAAEICVKNNIPYVTIDCPPDSYLCQHAAIAAISGEYLRENYAGIDREEVFAQYIQNMDGLLVFTGGGGEVLYGRKDGPVKTRKAYQVKVKSTLGAGDTFKAGCIYAVSRHMDDDKAVQFACACASSACMEYPIPLYPPTMERIEALINS